MGTFERVSYPDHLGRRRTVLLKDVTCSEQGGRVTLSGMQVDREGDLVEPSAADLKAEGAETGTVQHIIFATPGEIRRTKMVEDWLTGRLVVDGKADQQINRERYR